MVAEVAEVAVAASPPPAGAAGTQLTHSISPPTIPARGRRQGVHGSFLPHPTSSSLGGMDEKQQCPKLYFRTGTWREIQEEAAVPSQGHRSQAVAMQSSFSRELRPILPLIFSLDVKLDSSSSFYFVLPLSATPNPLLKYFGTMATQVRRLNPEVSLVTFLPVHLLKQNILLLPLVVISLHIHRHLKEQIHTKIACEPKRCPAQSTLTLSQTLTSCPPPKL